MDWHKHLGSKEKENFYGYLNILAVSAVLFSLIIQQPFLLVIAGLLFAFLIFSRKYDKEIGRKLFLVNEKKSIRLFAEKEANITLVFKNESRIPIMNAELTFDINDKVTIEHYKGLDSNDGQKKYQLPISIVGGGESTLTLPFKAKRRGVTRLKNLQLTFPHLINFRSIDLQYRFRYLTDVIVYPKPKVVAGLKEAYFNTIGEQRTNFSPFEDMLNPVGTRDYVSSDPFHRIHWKASVKKQSFQTKVLEKTRDNTWIFVINLATTTHLGNMYYSKNMENLLSYATFVCNYATKLGIPFEIYLNTRQGNRLYLGQGKEHLKGALEFLAQVSDQSTLISLPKLLYRIDHHLNKPHTILLFGENPEGSNEYVAKWKRQGMNVYKVIETEDGAALDIASKVGDQLVRN